MATSLISDVVKKTKSNAVKSVGSAMFGSGVVGGALNKAFQKKFGDKEEKDTRVSEALESQTKAQDENSATLTRIETIVMNIADNVYNLAGIMNAQVVSMHEAQKLQQDRVFKENAAKEQAAEALAPQQASPATKPAATKEEGGFGGILSSIMDSVSGTRKMFVSFTKKFGVLALGLTAALGLGVAAAKSFFDSNEQKDAKLEDVNPESPPGPLENTSQQDTEGTATSKENLPDTGAGGGRGGQGGPTAQEAVNTPTAPPPPAPVVSNPTTSSGGATPAKPPPQPAASQQATDPDIDVLKDYFDRPENAMDKMQLQALWTKKQQLQSGLVLAKQNNDSKLAGSIVENITSVDDTRSEIIQRGKKAISPAGGQGNAPSATPVSAPPASATSFGNKAETDPKEAREFILNSKQIGVDVKPDGSFVDVQSGNPVTEQQLSEKIQATGKDPAKVLKQLKTGQSKSSGGAQIPEASNQTAAPSSGGDVGPMEGSSGGGGGGGGGGATPVPPAPSSGADIATASTDVAAAAEPKPPQTSSTEINTGSNENNPLPSLIPTPVANRGTLDVGTVFESES